MTIFYELDDKLYINITNRCPCDCLFCVRQRGAGIGSASSLWLPREPSMDEVRAAFDSADLRRMTEIVFCGYGEPMERAFDVLEISKYIKSKTDLPIRINTNGLVMLMHPSFDISSLSIIDSVSISLNADDKDEYTRITRPKFGPAAYDAMLSFAKEAGRFTKVFFTVVDTLEDERIENCRKIARKAGVELRVRAEIA